MGALWALSGAVRPDGATIAVRVDSGTVRVAVADNAALSNAVWVGPATPTNGIVKLAVTGLQTDTQYYFAPEIAGVLDLDTLGKFRTDPPIGAPADVLIRAFSCGGDDPDYPGVGSVLAANRVSNSPGYTDVINRQGARRTVHMGDWTYYNLGSDAFGITGGSSVSNLRRLVDDFNTQPNQRVLYLDAPTVFQNDDHELRNDHDRTDEGLPRLRQVFGERFPHNPLPAPDCLYRTEDIGRVTCIYLDSRSGRDPNTTPDGSGKSMLGPSQRYAFEQTLATSTSQFLLIFSPSVWWEPARKDGWAVFADEQDWVIDRINRYGWKGRVAIICGDVHALGMDTGTKSPGGIPTATFASIDSSYGSVLTQNDRGPTHPGRRQHGTIRIRDTGSRVEITLTGYIENQVWDSYSWGFDVDQDDDGGSDDLPPPTNPEPRRTVDWIACDLVTGELLAYLPGVRGSISRALGAYTQDSLTVPIPLAGPGALRSVIRESTTRARTMIVCIVNSVPVWAGIVLKAVGGTVGDITFSVVSLEGYLARRYVADHSWTQRDESSVIAAGLVADAQVEGIGLLLDCPPTGTLRDRSYLDQDDGTVYDRLVELMGVEDGPEWTIDLDWISDRQQGVAKIFRVRKRIGRTKPGATISSTGAARARYT
ncbi:MAG: alkaline phosphatase D family protein, partial [Stackebrandtia sp.]